MVQVISEQEYVMQNGGDEIIGQSILIQSHIARNGESVSFLMKEIDRIMPINRRLRAEYWRKVEAHELRPYTLQERLVRAARGHEDNEATWAARRVCQKRGISWS